MMLSQGLVTYHGDRGYHQDGSKLGMRAAVRIWHLPFEAASQSQRGWTFEARHYDAAARAARVPILVSAG